MKRRLVAIFGYFGFANTGDEAILHCMMGQFRILQQQDPNLDFVVFSVDPENTRSVHQVDAVPSVLPPTYVDFVHHFVRGDRKAYRLALRTFLKSDIFVVGGGGLFFDHPTSNLYFRRLLAKMKWAKRLGKRVAAFGVGVGPIHLDESRRLLRRILSNIDLITVRDDESHRLLESFGVTGPPIHTTGDFVYLLDAAPDPRVCEIMNAESLRIKERPRIAVCLYGDQLRMESIRSSLVRFCEYATSELRADLWFVPMQIAGGYDDRLGGRQLFDQLACKDHVYLVEGAYTPWETMGLMRRCDAVLGMRLHGVILAVNNRTPVFGISYMPKVERVFNDMGHPEWQLTPDRLTPQALVAGFRQLWDRREYARELLDAFSGELHRKALANFSIFAAKLPEWQDK
ncbi:MAG TPA: polysaccharide pyruvyl transferase family protein [Candidatus Acidoferrum sp.]|nr:polysaccharide pyruvyl transferase family protein [Candidatus Acidoferrum sp.]